MPGVGGDRRVRLNIGCGRKPRHAEGFVNVDKNGLNQPDLLFDCETFPWPWGDNSAEEIRAFHSLEHMGQDPKVFLEIIKEMHRVLHPNGILHIKVPHPYSYGWIQDFTHVRIITPTVLAAFSKKSNQHGLDNGWPVQPYALDYDIDFDFVKIEYHVMPEWQSQPHDMVMKAMDRYIGVCDEIEMVLRKVA